MRLKIQIRHFTFIGLTVILTGINSCSKMAPDIVATVNGEPVSVIELTARMPEYRAAVVQHFLNNHQADYTKDFWNTAYDGITPGEMLKEKAMDDLVRIKLQQILARENKLLEDISYAAFLEQWRQENTRRQTAVSNGQVVYGPVQFSEQMYYRYYLSKLTLELKHKLAKNGFNVSDNELKQYFEEEYDAVGNISFQEQYTYIKDRYIDEQYEKLIDKMKAKAKIAINYQVFQTLS